MKKVLAISLVLVMILSVFSGCLRKKDKYPIESDYQVDGTGDSSSRNLTINLFDQDITIGKTTVGELMDNKWGTDPETWEDVDMDAKVEYKVDSFSGKVMDKGTIEITIAFKNLTDSFTDIRGCILTSISIRGLANMQKGNLTFLDGMENSDSIEEFESNLKSKVSSYNYKSAVYEYSEYKYYTVELEDGTMKFDYTIDREDNSVSNVSFSVNLDYDYSIK